MSVTSLVTNGYICYRGQPIPVPAPSSLETPEIVGVVEVRPKIRRVTPPDDAGAPKPSVVSAQELKPVTTGRVTPDPVTVQPPTTRAAQELKPKIVKAEEED
jgi:hypothetical protein